MDLHCGDCTDSKDSGNYNWVETTIQVLQCIYQRTR